MKIYHINLNGDKWIVHIEINPTGKNCYKGEEFTGRKHQYFLIDHCKNRVADVYFCMDYVSKKA